VSRWNLIDAAVGALATAGRPRGPAEIEAVRIDDQTEDANVFRPDQAARQRVVVPDDVERWPDRIETDARRVDGDGGGVRGAEFDVAVHPHDDEAAGGDRGVLNFQFGEGVGGGRAAWRERRLGGADAEPTDLDGDGEVWIEHQADGVLRSRARPGADPSRAG